MHSRHAIWLEKEPNFLFFFPYSVERKESLLYLFSASSPAPSLPSRASSAPISSFKRTCNFLQFLSALGKKKKNTRGWMSPIHTNFEKKKKNEPKICLTLLSLPPSPPLSLPLSLSSLVFFFFISNFYHFPLVNLLFLSLRSLSFIFIYEKKKMDRDLTDLNWLSNVHLRVTPIENEVSAAASVSSGPRTSPTSQASSALDVILAELKELDPSSLVRR